MRNYSGERLVSNLAYLIQEKKVKLSEVESAIGISAGYLSKMMKKGAEANPSIELVWKLSQYFDVSMERLLNTNLTNSYDNMRLLTSLARFLKVETLSGRMEWRKIPIETINNSLIKDDPVLPIIGTRKRCIPIEEPYPELIPDGVSESCTEQFAIRSLTFMNTKLYATGAACKGLMAEKSWLHIYRLGGVFQDVSSDSDKEGGKSFQEFYELWLEDIEEGESEPIGPIHYVCATKGTTIELEEAVHDLYEAVMTAQTDVKLDAIVKERIESFLGSGDKE